MAITYIGILLSILSICFYSKMIVIDCFALHALPFVTYISLKKMYVFIGVEYVNVLVNVRFSFHWIINYERFLLCSIDIVRTYDLIAAFKIKLIYRIVCQIILIDNLFYVYLFSTTRKKYTIHVDSRRVHPHPFTCIHLHNETNIYTHRNARLKKNVCKNNRMYCLSTVNSVA